jgi:hypothetical protein
LKAQFKVKNRKICSKAANSARIFAPEAAFGWPICRSLRTFGRADFLKEKCDPCLCAAGKRKVLLPEVCEPSDEQILPPEVFEHMRKELARSCGKGQQNFAENATLRLFEGQQNSRIDSQTAAWVPKFSRNSF